VHIVIYVSNYRLLYGHTPSSIDGVSYYIIIAMDDVDTWSIKITSSKSKH